MNQKLSKIEITVPLITVILDIAAILGAFLSAYYVRFYTTFTNIFSVEKGFPELSMYIYFALFTLPVWILTLQNFKMYKLRRTVFIGDEFIHIVKCVSVSILLSIGITFFFRDESYSRLVFVLIWTFGILYITIGRYIMLKVEKTFYNNNVGLRNIAIVGMSEIADGIYKTLSKDKFTGFRMVGFFANDKNESEFAEAKTYLGNIESIPQMIRENRIQNLLFCLPHEQNHYLYTIIKNCEGINVEFMLVPDFMELISSRIKITELHGIPLMIIKTFPLSAWDRIVKRLFDIFASLFLLIMISPILVFIALLIKLTSKGPVFYKQERVSIDGSKFDMLKFRSMKIDAEADGTPKFASKHDSRHTSIGTYLRKFSLDELPQFLNVLRGDMSIVGPRPEREYFINIMKNTVNKYLERHRVKCGITGWAQVNGLRGSESPMQTRIEYDIYYIENWSLVFDIKIILKTLKEMFFSKSAF
ncbi:MAG: undecaprenyl-phosphate glucose phosphotransferase [Ignavibacteria bacterium]